MVATDGNLKSLASASRPEHLGEILSLLAKDGGDMMRCNISRNRKGLKPMHAGGDIRQGLTTTAIHNILYAK